MDNLREILEPMKRLIVVGGQWGDEGKGKIVDLLAMFYDIIARYSGGSGAGHTTWLPDGRKLVGHQIPCGMAQGKTCVLARGVFFDFARFCQELKEAEIVLDEQIPVIAIDKGCPLWTPWHALLEAHIENVLGAEKIRTTGRGIGPLAALLKLRLGPEVGDIKNPYGLLKTRLENLYLVLLPIIHSMVEKGLVDMNDIPNPEETDKTYFHQDVDITPLICDTSLLLHNAIRSNERILFEGAQAIGLDNRWGTYPYVSSGDSTAAGAAINTGLPMETFNGAIMVFKVFPTRVGAGPFPTEIWDREGAEKFAQRRKELFVPGSAERKEFLTMRLEQINQAHATEEAISNYLQVLGYERGASTGRGRSVGLLDIPWLQYAIRINGPKWLALTRFDMLSGLKSVPVCEEYGLYGSILEPGVIPSTDKLDEVAPRYELWECWPEDIAGITVESQLPATAQNFLTRLEDRLGVPILLVGTGESRNAVIVRHAPVPTAAV
ncbi:adenylosuccinate synthetase [bacterium]|nr:MAG: adenylosuccinate synthetase [bacterium]